MSQYDRSEIEKRAHQIWEREGRPEGKAEEHWRRAVSELEREMVEGAKAFEEPGRQTKRPARSPASGIADPDSGPAGPAPLTSDEPAEGSDEVPPPTKRSAPRKTGARKKT